MKPFEERREGSLVGYPQHSAVLLESREDVGGIVLHALGVGGSRSIELMG